MSTTYKVASSEGTVAAHVSENQAKDHREEHLVRVPASSISLLSKKDFEKVVQSAKNTNTSNMKES